VYIQKVVIFADNTQLNFKYANKVCRLNNDIVSKMTDNVLSRV